MLLWLLLLWLQYTFSELLDIVQASELELRQALIDFNACVIHGKFFDLQVDCCGSINATLPHHA